MWPDQSESPEDTGAVAAAGETGNHRAHAHNGGGSVQDTLLSSPHIISLLRRAGLSQSEVFKRRKLFFLHSNAN